jgi:molybdenum cofactor guanylyltransferase
MGRDKALLQVHDLPQVVWTARLLAPFCVDVACSCRPDQDIGAGPRRVPPGGPRRIHDVVSGQGPMAGLAAAHADRPRAAWLVVACDLPRLTVDTLRRLVAARDPACIATAYRSAHDVLPEPRCAVYEPGAFPIAAAAMAEGLRCPRRLLIREEARVRLLDLADPGSLDNANTPEDLASIVGRRP